MFCITKNEHKMLKIKNNIMVISALCLGALTARGAGLRIAPAGRYAIKVSPSTECSRVPGQAAVRESDDSRAITEGVMKLRNGYTASLANGTLTVTDSKGKVVLHDDGTRTQRDGNHHIALATNDRGALYGAGERGHKLNLRGDTLHMYNRQNYGYTGTDPRINQMGITMPLFMSAQGYGVVFDDYGKGQMVLGDSITYDTDSPCSPSYYVVTSDIASLQDMTRALTDLTGRQELPPLWTLGYITSKYGYHTQAETEGVIDTLKAAGYPVDGVILDLYWYGKEQDMGRLAWDAAQWPDPVDMMAYLKQRGVHLIPISQPYVLRNGKGVDNYSMLSDRGLLLKDSAGNNQEVTIWVGEGGMFDMSNPHTKQWLATRYKQLTDMGVSGWWGDLGEPEVHPITGVHANGLRASQYHNRYGNDWSDIIYRMNKENFPDERMITMMRAGTTGLQRYNVFPWSTDVSRSWGGLQPQINIMIQSGLSGLGYMGHDVGGFAVDPNNARDPELYVRWLQLGTFSPMLRTHAQQYAEPYHYPEYEGIIKRFINERYRWLPYNYTAAYLNARHGYPLVQPLNFEAEDDKAADINDQYMWGADVMVAPVLEQGARERKVYFPAGFDWVDLNEPSRIYKGGTEAVVPAPLEELPMFVRGGGFIATADYPMHNTAGYRRDRYTINYYPTQGAVSQSLIFEDDLKTPSSKSDNRGLLMILNGQDSAKEYNITLSSMQGYENMPLNKTMTLVVNGVAKDPGKVTVNGINTRYTFDKNKHTVTVNLNWKVTDRLDIIFPKK